MVEGLGILARFHLTGGEAGDNPEALPLLGTLRPGALHADKAYDTDAILEYLANNRIEAIIPPRRHRRIKQFRRIATRYDKLAERFSSFIALTASFIWLA
ncbi:IS5 family transposase [Betaproteobacteria bacterium]|nr:IS5 family transposase [Betaproteobacteria bacterium]